MEDPAPEEESKLDEALEGTFPASDALANTVATGIRPVDASYGRDTRGTDAQSSRQPELGPVTRSRR